MARISIDPEEARSAANAATSAAEEAENNLSTLTQNCAVLDSMEGDWRTRGWDQIFDDYTKQAQQLTPTLEALTKFLDEAATAFEDLSSGFA